MEIIHIILGKANPDRMNGVNKVVFQLASHQHRAGKTVSVWGITRQPVHDYGERAFSTRLFQAYRNPFRLDSRLKEALLQQTGDCVVHLHGGWIPVYAPLSAFLHRHRIPFVLTAHGAYNTLAMQRSRRVKQLYFQAFEKHVLRRARHIHALGESEVAGIARLYAVPKTVLLPYGFQAGAPEMDRQIPDGPFTIGFVGRLDSYTKGLDLLAAAFATFRQAAPDARLWIVGDGPDRKQVEQSLHVHGIAGQTVLWGSKFGAEKEALMRQMHVFAHPSRNEGLPASVIEAAALGIPAVVSGATNMGSYLRASGAGLVVPDGDAAALAEAFASLYATFGTPALREMGERASTLVQTAFDWDVLVERFDRELYQP